MFHIVPALARFAEREPEPTGLSIHRLENGNEKTRAIGRGICLWPMVAPCQIVSAIGAWNDLGARQKWPCSIPNRVDLPQKTPTVGTREFGYK